jgi:hypothetical protein
LWVVWVSFGDETTHIGLHSEPNIRFQFSYVSLVFDLSLYDFSIWHWFGWYGLVSGPKLDS